MTRVSLPSNDVQAWQSRLDLDAGEIEACTRLLSAEERARAARFHFDQDRRRFTVARGKLRQLLGNHLQVQPEQILFSYGKNGKPEVTGRFGHIHFNVSHSEERALYAISRRCQVGADIEYLQRNVDWQALSLRFLAPGESLALRNLPPGIRKEAFLACWTRKEAVVKATGDGMSLPLDEFEVTVDPRTEPRILNAGCMQASDWVLHAADLGDEYIGTVAAYRQHCRT